MICDELRADSLGQIGETCSSLDSDTQSVDLSRTVYLQVSLGLAWTEILQGRWPSLFLLPGYTTSFPPPPHLFKVIHLLLWGVCTRAFFWAEMHPLEANLQTHPCTSCVGLYTEQRSQALQLDPIRTKLSLKTYSMTTHSLLPSLRGVQSTSRVSIQDKTPWNVYTNGSHHCDLLLISITS